MAKKKKKVVVAKPILNKYASKIAKIEGKKSQVKIGDIREILSIFFNIIAEEAEQVSAKK